MNLQEIYRQTVNKKSDINEHLPILLKYGNMCDTIIEMGVRTGRSTLSWLMVPNCKLTCYDLKIHKNLPLNTYKEWAVSQNIDFTFNVADTTKFTIDKTDLLFIDTLHVCSQLRKELQLHSDKVNKFIILHDTETYAITGELKNTIGLQPAIDEFVTLNKEWGIREVFKNNNGLTVLERI